MSLEELKKFIGSVQHLRAIDSKYYEHVSLNKSYADDAKISIVMTSCNRSKQVYYTLKTIQWSATKVHIILVDDSDMDPINIELLKEFDIYIDFIRINRDKKCWVNPCVNYNIGFQFIQCEKVIIQNGEVCHVGDVCTYVDENTKEDVYNVYNVMCANNDTVNTTIYANKSMIDLFSHISEPQFKTQFSWYQHPIHRPGFFHFLVSLSRETFKKIGGFSYDYYKETDYDDNDFLLKIRSKQIAICAVDELYTGVHLWHPKTMGTYYNIHNQQIFLLKEALLNSTQRYIEISENTPVDEPAPLPTIVTILGIRPDFIRMSHILSKLDSSFHHIAIHTGQHYDKYLYEVFLKELNIRKPDYILSTGQEATNHYEQLSYLAKAVPDLLKREKIDPALIMFLGDSNSAAVALPLKKEGYRIGHIEAGMRSYDKRMLEELNRITCDHCSDILFVYHEDYKRQLIAENIKQNVFVVGNTVVEPIKPYRTELLKIPKRTDMILMDIHRPENFNYRERLEAIIQFGNECHEKYGLPVKLLHFKRMKDSFEQWNIKLGKIELVDLMEYSEYLRCVYNCKFIISDSGTGQEEPALLHTPVIVPRDYTERPQSYTHNCSFKFDCKNYNSVDIFHWLETDAQKADTSWLGDGTTSEKIIQHLKTYLQETL